MLQSALLDSERQPQGHNPQEINESPIVVRPDPSNEAVTGYPVLEASN